MGSDLRRDGSRDGTEPAIVAVSVLVLCSSRDVAESVVRAFASRGSLELEVRALGKRFLRLGDERAHNRAGGFDASDEAGALPAHNEKCFFVAGRDGLVEFGEHGRRVDLDLVCSCLPTLDELGAQKP